MNLIPNLTQLIGYSVVFLLLQILGQTHTFVREKGAQWNASARDGPDNAPKTVIAGRAQRALENYKETLPAFLALALFLLWDQETGGIGYAGALVWFCARQVYYPLYLFGVPYLRSLAWLVSIVGLGLMVWALFF